MGTAKCKLLGESDHGVLAEIGQTFLPVSTGTSSRMTSTRGRKLPELVRLHSRRGAIGSGPGQGKAGFRAGNHYRVAGR